MTNSGKRPAKEIRFGLVKACIWKNQSKHGLHYKITLARIFKDGDTWRESTRFGREDLPLVAKAADMAHTWIYTQGRADASTQLNQTESEEWPNDS